MGNHCIDFRSDEQYIAMNHGKTYMTAVSPWFFTVRSCSYSIILLLLYNSYLKHYGPDSWNKNWIYRGDEWLYNARWEMLVDNREHIDIVQILSWNGEFIRNGTFLVEYPLNWSDNLTYSRVDYGESHYIGPIRADQPDSHAWVDGFDHNGVWHEPLYEILSKVR